MLSSDTVIQSAIENNDSIDLEQQEANLASEDEEINHTHFGPDDTRVLSFDAPSTRVPRGKKKKKKKGKNKSNNNAVQGTSANNNSSAPVPTITGRGVTAPIDSASTHKIKLGAPIRSINDKKMGQMMTLFEMLLKKVVRSTATEEDVLAFLHSPSFVTLDLDKISSLVTNSASTVNDMIDIINNSDVRTFSSRSDDAGTDDSGSSVQVASTIKSCKRLIRKNRAGAASHRLDSWTKGDRPASLDDPSVIQRLQALHPSADDRDALPLGNNGDLRSPLVIRKDAIAAVIMDLPKESGTGIYSWTYELVQILWNHSETLRDLIATLFTKMATGILPHSSVWLRSRIIALENTSSAKIRPIAVSDPWIRVGARIISNLVLGECGPFLSNHQLGIGKKGGAEILVHTTSLVKDSILNDTRSTNAIITLDCTNAFNSIRRSFIAEGIKEACPQLLPFFQWSYGSPVDLMVNAKQPLLRSCTGVRQGDPLGPLFFSLGIAKALRAATTTHSNFVLYLAFLDDIVLLGDATKCLAVMEDIERKFRPLGLTFNRSKCRMFTRPENQVATDIPRTDEGLSVLGIPIGKPEFVSSKLQHLSGEQTASLDKLKHFAPAEAFVLLKSCFNTRPIYSMRGLAPELTAAMASSHDAKMESALAATVGVSSLPPTSVEVKNLPATLGGVGMRGMKIVHRGAWTSSWVSSLQSAKVFYPTFFDQWIQYSSFDVEVVREFFPDIPEGTSDPRSVILPIIDSQDSLPSQKELVSKKDKAIHERLLNDLKASEPLKAAWLSSSSVKGISSWLYSATNPLMDNTISDDAFRDGLRLRLLLDVFDDPPGIRRKCSCIHDQGRDMDKFHALACKIPSAIRKKRHDYVRNHIAKFLETIAPTMSVSKEIPVPNPLPRKGTCVADLAFTIENSLKFLDVAITTPCTISVMSRNTRSVAGAPAADKEKDKMSKYKDSYGPEILPHLIPFVVESTGRLGKQAEAFIAAMMARTHVDPRYDKKLKAAKVLLSRQIAATLVEYNSRIFRVVQNKSTIVGPRQSQ